jgi:hypothetical protein
MLSTGSLAPLLAALLGLEGCGSPDTAPALAGGGSSASQPPATAATGGSGPADGGGSSIGGSPNGGSINGSPTTGGSSSTGGAPPVLPPFSSEDPAPEVDTEYEKVLRLSVRFYGAQRSGNNHNWLLMQYATEPGCFNADGQSVGGLDLTGGWHDAGDHIKPVLTNGYASLLMLKAYQTFPYAFDDLYGPADPMGPNGDVRGIPNGIPDVLDEVKHAADFLQKGYFANTLLIQVGDSYQDHRQSLPCTEQEDLETTAGGEMSDGVRVGRPVATGMNGHVAGLAIGALAAMSRHYQPFDAAAAAGYLAAAQAMYTSMTTARNTPGHTPTAIQPYDAATRESVGMLCGAAELYITTGEPSYFTDATALGEEVAEHYWAANFENPHEFCLASLYDAAQKAGERSTALGKWLNNLNITTTDGLIHDSTWGDWGVLRYATTAAFSAALSSVVDGTNKHQALALSQLDWVMGANPHNRSFICGYGVNPPVHPHHRNAHPGDTTSPALVLYGSLVGGPAPGAVYEDTFSNYEQNEVAIDYNAGLVGLAAFAVHTERVGAISGG